MWLQNIRVQLNSILTGTGMHELHTDILRALPGGEIRMKVGFARKGSKDVGDDTVLVRVGALPRMGDTRRPAGIVNITGCAVHKGAGRVWREIIFVAAVRGPKRGRHLPEAARNCPIFHRGKTAQLLAPTMQECRS